MFSFTWPPCILSNIVILASITNALRLPIDAAPSGHLARRAPAPKNPSVPVATFQNIQYMVNVTVGGEVYSTAIDTGSEANLNYGIGSVSGDILQALVSFGGYDIPSQAFNLTGAGAHSVEVQNITSYGEDPHTQGYTALVGLGPTKASIIYGAFNSTVGFPVMNNIFTQNVTDDSYITLLLPRAYDPEGDSTGVMRISELVAGYEALANQTKLPLVLATAPGGLQHWTTFIDANGILGPNGQPIDVTSNVTAAAGTGKLVAMFDSGFTLPQVPKAITDALYSGMLGAEFVNVPDVGEIWSLPCDQEVNATFIFGGQKIFVHPLDVNAVLDPTVPINSSSICYGAFQTISADAANPDYDMILGMSFLRNAHILLEYGSFNVDTLTGQDDPFIQLLAITNATEAHNDFIKLRGINNNRTTTGSNNSTVPTSSTTKSAAKLSFSPRAIYWSFVAAAIACL
ncbi:hypothetical protein FRB97_001602 [Tulasnella sp. 331]|nr:hypothetical protein FRB97_001602 [Tulasnella sp. 331]